ncbi:MAG: T9SS type A sorting domain-containing protein [Ignavibacteria bacterium]|nr:T9SS type A sorting domain-containing protein [Ignavibacteria bacterium]
MNQRTILTVLLMAGLSLLLFSALQSRPTFNGTTPGCAAAGCHTLQEGAVSVVALGGLDVEVTLSGVSSGGNVAGELVDMTGTVVDVVDNSGTNPFILTAPEPGEYTVNAGYKEPSRTWDSSLVVIGGGSGTTMACDDISQYGARCNSSGAVQSIVKVLNGDFGGETLTWLVDGEPIEVTVISDGSRSVARMAVPHAGIGAHTVELVDPAGCYGEDIVVCQVDAAPEPEMDALWNEYDQIVQAVERANAHPMETRILGNYPNPFNPSTTIRYSLGVDSPVSVRVYNMLGQEVATLVDGFQKAGEQSVAWHGVNNFGQAVASGLYFYRIQTGNTVMTQKMLFTK